MSNTLTELPDLPAEVHTDTALKAANSSKWLAQIQEDSLSHNMIYWMPTTCIFFPFWNNLIPKYYKIDTNLYTLFTQIPQLLTSYITIIQLPKSGNQHWNNVITKSKDYIQILPNILLKSPLFFSGPVSHPSLVFRDLGIFKKYRSVTSLLLMSPSWGLCDASAWLNSGYGFLVRIS